MSKSKLVLIAVLGGLLLSLPARAQIQVTNVVPVPATILETLESATGQVIIKGSTPMGSISVNGAQITVICKEDVVASTGHKEHGVLVEISVNGQPDDKTVVDYDELDALLGALDYMNSVTWSVTSLSSFDVNYTTKAGLRVAVFSSKRSGQIEFGLRSSRMWKSMILAPDQRAQFRSLLGQAKTMILSLRNG